MELILYKCSDDVKKVFKNPREPKTYDVALKGNYNKDNPVFMLTRPSDDYYLNGYNYAYFPTFGAWYWVELTMCAGGLCQVSCSIDPLMTNRNSIAGLTCLVSRQEKYYDPYLSDPLLPIAQGGVIKASNVGTVGESTSNIYITCIGAYTPEEATNE